MGADCTVAKYLSTVEGRMSSNPRTPRLSRVLPILVCLAVLSWEIPSSAKTADSCVDCHGDPILFVTNKKLYDYFQKWTLSVHQQEDVTCADCHGGNPEIADKDGAHGANLAEAKKESAVNFRNIPRTCGECHDEIYTGFRKSSHFEHVLASKQEDQGPTCVTCHGSINVAVLNVTTVEQACSRCHNEESDNHPENAEEARLLLNRFLSIHRYYRYITVRGDPQETKAFFERIDAQIRNLSVTWHTFDLDRIRDETRTVLGSLKEKRQEVARIFKENRQKRP
jgi:nitrate/TMAO reductase-like tetraheme cytochrome c subunit